MSVSMSPYQQLRKNRQIKVDVHGAPPSSFPTSPTSPTTPITPTSPASPTPPTNPPPSAPSAPSAPPASTTINISSFPTVEKKKNVWIKPKSNAVEVPQDILDLLTQDIERRHVGQSQAEEIIWYQSAQPLSRSIRNSWATGVSLMLIIVSIFICVGIWFYVPSYLRGSALIPPIIAVIVCALLAKRVRVDLTGCYALTKNRAIIIVPRKHLGFLKPLVLNFDFLTEKNLIMVQYQEARLQDKILTREPILADLAHGPHATATASFYPRTKFAIPFRFYNIQHSHAFEVDFTDMMNHTPTPVGGGRLRVEKPDFERQRHAAKIYKLYPIIGAIWFLIIIGVISALLWGVFYTQVKSHLTIAMVVLSWVFAVSLSVASFYPIYSLSRSKRESIANARYVKYAIDKN